MRPDELHRIATEAAFELPLAELTFPFGPDWEVFKVAGRIFLLMTESTGPQMATVKVVPREGRALVEAFDDVIPGYHMNKTHWATVLADSEEEIDEGGARRLPAEELRELIVSSYLLVVATLAKKDRPVAPYAYGDAHDRRRADRESALESRCR